MHVSTATQQKSQALNDKRLCGFNYRFLRVIVIGVMQNKKIKYGLYMRSALLLLVYCVSTHCYASDANPPPMDLLGEWRVVEMETEQNHYTEISNCGLARVAIRPDRANEYYPEYGFMFKACISNERNFHFQCFTSPEPGVLKGISGGISCAIIMSESCNLFMKSREVQWQCEQGNLSHSECIDLEKRYRQTNFCINERQSLKNQHSISIPEAITGYQFVDSQLVLYGNASEKMLLQRHKWLPGIEKEQPANNEHEPNQ